MIISFHAALPVSTGQSVNALADREFLASCLDGIRFERNVADDLLRGTFSFGDSESETTYQFGVRLVDFDADGHSVTYEAYAREVNGQGLASLVVDLDVNVDGAKSALVANSRLEMVGMDSSGPYANLEQAVADKLGEVGTRIVAALGEDTGRAWRPPGASVHRNPNPPTSDAVPAKATISPMVRRALLPFGAVSGTSVIAYLVWRVIRATRVQGSKEATS